MIGDIFEADVKIHLSTGKAFDKACSILEFLGWNYESNGDDYIVATVPSSAFGWGEKLAISFERAHHLQVTSQSRNPFQWLDMGKNQSNVEKFLDIFRKSRYPFNAENFEDEKPKSWLGRFLSGR